MGNKTVMILIAISTVLFFSTQALSQESPVEKALNVPGARVTLPVEAAKKPFPKEFVAGAQKAFNSFHEQMLAGQ